MKPDIDRGSSRSEVVISDEVYQTAGLPREELQRKEITVRGRTAPSSCEPSLRPKISRQYSSGLRQVQWRQHEGEQPARNCKSFTFRSSSAFGVRREKGALSSGCKSHPATAP